jgi:ubiquinone/menaquinone biosynthesis C-methylase UbiE
MDQSEMTASQFGSSAADYLTSTVHATGADLEQLERLAARLPPGRVLDLGCGAGHASFALARGGAQRVTAFDPSPEMLAVVARAAADRGYSAIDTCLGRAERLPFVGGTFECIISRFSAHHWSDVPAAMTECARVLRPGGRLIVIDVIAPETPLLDTALQVIEFLRDASHVRNYRLSEWRALQSAAGFHESSVGEWRLALDFDSWVARIKTPPERVAALIAVFAALPAEARSYLQVTAERAFGIEAAWIEAIL